MRHRLPAFAAAVLAALLPVGLLTVPAHAEDTTSVTAGIASSLSWRSCRSPELYYYDLDCATLTVPLDHDDPSGETITLALTRRLHTSAEEDYQGVMLVNPGGPGGSGLSLAGLGDYVPGDAAGTYDWIGFDPRGVGSSTPSLHCSRSYFGTNRPSYVPTRRWISRYWLKKDRAYAAACSDSATEQRLLPHLTTLDSVADMDSIREALGADTLNYYGFSYGTYLGQVYATLHPDRVGRFVLDGVVDPDRVWYDANTDQDRAFDANMDVFWAYLARHPRVFRLGRNAGKIKRGYYKLLRRLDRRPAAHRRLGPSELADAMLEAGYYVYEWDVLGAAYSRLVRRGKGQELFNRYRDGQMGDDNGFAVYNAVSCTDAPWPGWGQTRDDTWALHAVAPFLSWGNTWYNGACLTWSAPAQDRPQVSGEDLTAKILLISETGDAATPYSGALRVRSLFPTASLVAGVGGTTHSSSLSGVPCVDDTVAEYLGTGFLPPRADGNGPDKSCPGLRPPPASGAGFRVGSGEQGDVDRLSPILRADLIQAQLHR